MATAPCSTSFDQRVIDWTAEAEASERFPRKLSNTVGRGSPLGLHARLGGADEVLWELVAAAMTPDYDGYEEMIGGSSQPENSV